jgi:hypothetical protein
MKHDSKIFHSLRGIKQIKPVQWVTKLSVLPTIKLLSPLKNKLYEGEYNTQSVFKKLSAVWSLYSGKHCTLYNL